MAVGSDIQEIYSGVADGSEVTKAPYVGLFVGAIIEWILVGKFKATITKKKMIFLAVAIIAVAIVFLTNRDIVFRKVMEIADLLDIKNRVKTEGSANTHLYYLTSIPEITIKNDFISNLFGYGPGCSGYAQSELMNLYVTSDKWSIECDYVNQLWSYGYIGFVVYYYWYLKNLVKTIKIDKKYTALFAAFLFEGLLYNITFNWVLFLVISIFLLAKSRINIFKLDTVLCESRTLIDNLFEGNTEFFVFKDLLALDEYVAVSSWLMYAKAQNPYLKTVENMLLEYWKAENYLCNYFLLHIFICIVAELKPDEWKKIPAYSCQPPHILQNELFDAYDKRRFNQLMEMSSIHKLSYKFAEEQFERNDTVYQQQFCFLLLEALFDLSF